MHSGNLVRIRYQTLSDLEILSRFLNEEHIMDTSLEMPQFTYKEQLIKKYKEHLEKDNDNDIHLAIETLEGEVIGAIGAGFIFWKNGLAFMYQYIGNKDYLDGGYMEEALRLFVSFAFMEKNIRKLKINVLSNNTKCLEVLMANGFKIEVTHKEDVLKHGKYLDMFDLALLRDEYINKDLVETK